MKTPWWCAAGAVGTAALLTVAAAASVPAFAFEKVQDGVYALNPDNPDELLEMEATPDMKVLIFSETKNKTLSEAHAQSLRKWVENGGVIWVHGDATGSPLLKLVDKDIRVEDYPFKKATTGKEGGELIQKDVSDKLIIHDHPLAEGVNRLYVYPARKFDGTRNVQPVVEMTDKNGNHGVVIGTVPLGKGYIVLDGTRASGSPLMFWKKANKDNPHAVKNAEGDWEDYDWDKLIENAVTLAKPTQAPRTSG